MYKQNKLIDMLDRATENVAKIGLTRDELKKAKKYTKKYKEDLAQQLVMSKEIILNQYWDYVLELANIRWSDLDLAE